MANVYRTGSIGLASWCMCADLMLVGGTRPAHRLGTDSDEPAGPVLRDVVSLKKP
jgi:hypothetical protein